MPESLSQALEAVMDGGGPVVDGDAAPDLSCLADDPHDCLADTEGAFWGLGMAFDAPPDSG